MDVAESTVRQWLWICCSVFLFPSCCLPKTNSAHVRTCPCKYPEDWNAVIAILDLTLIYCSSPQRASSHFWKRPKHRFFQLQWFSFPPLSLLLYPLSLSLSLSLSSLLQQNKPTNKVSQQTFIPSAYMDWPPHQSHLKKRVWIQLQWHTLMWLINEHEHFHGRRAVHGISALQADPYQGL